MWLGKEIPIGVRSLAFLAVGRGWRKAVGLRLYESAILHCGQVFQKHVSNVCLIRGSVSRCVPGISDLDFLAISETRDPETWVALRKEYANLKRRYPMLGGLQLTDTKTWKRFLDSNSGSRLWYREKRVYSDGQWHCSTFDFNVSAARRIAVGMFHFARAQCYFHQALKQGTLASAYYRMSLNRELHKATDALDGSPFPPWISAKHSLFELAQRLDEAALVSQLSDNSGADVEVRLSPKGGFPFFQIAPLDDFSDRVAQGPGTIPRVLVTPAMWNFYLSGWCWDDLKAALGILSVSEKKPIHFAQSWLEALSDRFHTHLVTVLVEFLAGDDGRFKTELKSLCRIAMMLELRMLTNIDPDLTSRSRLCETIRLFKHCEIDPIAPSPELVRSCLAELEAFSTTLPEN